jgi:tetratricopeptide (TPR) repeat protein
MFPGLQVSDQLASVISGCIASIIFVAGILRWVVKRTSRRRYLVSRSNRPGGKGATTNRVRECDPIALGVHRSIKDASSSGDPDLPSYISRDFDRLLRSELSKSRDKTLSIFLVGGSSSGKTRSAYEAIRAMAPDWSVIHSMNTESLKAELLSAKNLDRTVIWLNEAQDFLMQEGGEMIAAKLRESFYGATSVIIIGTVWPEFYSEMTKKGAGATFSAVRELLNGSTIIPVPGEFSSSELGEAREIAQSDSRIAAAIESGGASITQTLAAGPDLARQWQAAPDPYTRAVIDAAVDARILGAKKPLTREFLRAAALSTTHDKGLPRHGDWFSASLVYATERLKGATSVIEEVAIGTTDAIGYRATDYIYQMGLLYRLTSSVDEGLWDVIHADVADPEDLTSIARSAQRRNATRQAERLYLKAAEAGSSEARKDLSVLLRSQLRTAEAEDALTHAFRIGEPDAWLELYRFLAARGEIRRAEKVLLKAIKKGNNGVSRYASHSIGRRSYSISVPKVPTLGITTSVAPNGPRAELSHFLVDQGRSEEAIKIWANAVEEEEPNARVFLASLLMGNGRYPEAKEVLRVAADRGEPAARYDLAALYAKEGKEDEVIAIWREGIARFEPLSCQCLSDYLASRGRKREAEAVLREAVSAKIDKAPLDLAVLLVDQGRMDDARAVLQDAIRNGVNGARSHLADILIEENDFEMARLYLEQAYAEGDPDSWEKLVRLLIDIDFESMRQIEVLREQVIVGKDDAARILATLLAVRGMYGEAERVWRSAVVSGVWKVRYELAGFLAGRHRFNEAEEVLRQALILGEVHSVEALSDYLSASGKREEAERVRREAVVSSESLSNSRDMLAQILAEERRHREEESVLLDAVTAGELNARQNLARLYVRMGRVNEAERILREAIDIGEWIVAGLYVEVLLQLGNVDQAEDFLINSSDRPVHDKYLLMAQVQLAKRDDAAAEDALRKASERGEFMAAERHLEFLLSHGGWKRVLQADFPRRAIPGSFLVNLLREHRITKENLRDLVEVMPAVRHPTGAVERAKVLAEIEENAEAERLLRWAVRRDVWKSRVELGRFLHRLHRTDEAIAELEKAIIMQDFGAWVALALVLIDAGRKDEAQRVAWESIARNERSGKRLLSRFIAGSRNEYPSDIA